MGIDKKHIIHFTSKFTTLESILNSSSLLLSYSNEDFLLGTKKISRAAHPMVCFSQYNVNEINSQIITYGRYGIAFTESWVHKNKVHPVVYLSKDSIIANSLAILLKARRNVENSKLPYALRLPIMTIKCFTKNLTGYNSHLEEDDFRFIDENEWRFIPEKKEIGNALISQNRSTYLKNKDKYNNRLKAYPLRFKIEDIAFIFVSDNQEATNIEKSFQIDKVKIRISNWKSL